MNEFSKAAQHEDVVSALHDIEDKILERGMLKKTLAIANPKLR